MRSLPFWQLISKVFSYNKTVIVVFSTSMLLSYLYAFLYLFIKIISINQNLFAFIIKRDVFKCVPMCPFSSLLQSWQHGKLLYVQRPLVASDKPYVYTFWRNENRVMCLEKHCLRMCENFMMHLMYSIVIHLNTNINHMLFYTEIISLLRSFWLYETLWFHWSWIYVDYNNFDGNRKNMG